MDLNETQYATLATIAPVIMLVVVTERRGLVRRAARARIKRVGVGMLSWSIPALFGVTLMSFYGIGRPLSGELNFVLFWSFVTVSLFILAGTQVLVERDSHS